jgi:DNA-directed RNA polymerase specialized sigma24 family protein
MRRDLARAIWDTRAKWPEEANLEKLEQELKDVTVLAIEQANKIAEENNSTRWNDIKPSPIPEQADSINYASMFESGRSMAQATALTFAAQNKAKQPNAVIEKEALVALAQAASTWRPSSKVPFAKYVAAAVRNRLRDMLGIGKPKMFSNVRQLSYDEAIGIDGPAREESDAFDSSIASLHPGVDNIHSNMLAVANALPRKQAELINAALSGKSPAEIAESMGMSQQEMGKAFANAIKQVADRMIESGIANEKIALASPKPEYGDVEAIASLIKAFNEKMSPQKVRALYADVRREASFMRTLGRPDLANPAFGEARKFVDAVDEARKEKMVRQTHAQWQEAGMKMLADVEGVKRTILEKAADPDKHGLLTPIENKAAARLVAFMAHKVARNDEKAFDEAVALTSALRTARADVARSLASMRDEEMKPKERNAQFLMNLIFMPTPEVQQQIDKAPTAAQKSREISRLKAELLMLKAQPKPDSSIVRELERQVAEWTAKATKAEIERKTAKEDLARIRAAVEKMGVTLEEILAPDSKVYLRLRGDKIIGDFLSTLSEPERRAIRMYRDSEDLKTIQRATGINAADVIKLVDRFRADFIAKNKAKFKAGMKAEDIDLPNSPMGAPVNEDDANAEIERALALMGFTKNEQHRAARKRLTVRTNPRVTKPRAEMRNPFDDSAWPPKRKWTTQPNLGEAPNALPPDANTVETGGRDLNETSGDRQLVFGEDPNALPPSEIDIQKTDGVEMQLTEVDGQLIYDIPPQPRIDISSARITAQLGRMMMRAKRRENGSWFNMAYEWWIASLLSGPKTQAVNILGNAVSVAWELSVQRVTEIALNSMLKLVGKGDPYGAQIGDFAVMAKTLAPALATAWERAVWTWGSEVNLFNVEATNAEITWQNIKNNSKLEEDIGATGDSKAGRTIRIPMRALMATDEFFKQAIGQIHVAVIAHRIARARGLKGEAYTKLINELMIPGSIAWVEAVDEATRLVFQKVPEAGIAASAYRAMESARNKFLPFKFIVPFLRTPFAIFTTGLRKSPIGSIYMAERIIADGLWRINKKGDPVPAKWMRPYHAAEYVKHLSEQVLAWGATIMLYGAFEGDDDDDDKQFVITGSRSNDARNRGERELLNRVGLPPYTVRMGRIRWDYSRFEPLATVLGVTADTVRTWKLSDRTGGAHAVGKFMQAMMDQATNKTFVQGLANTAEVIRDPASSTSALADFIASWLPAIIRAPIRDMDTYVRDRSKEAASDKLITNFLDRLLTAVIPQFAPPRVDIYGRAVERAGHPIVRAFVPGYPQTEEAPGSVDRVLFRNLRQNPNDAWTPTPPRRTIGSGKDAIFLDKDTYMRYQRYAGQAFASDVLGAYIENPLQPTEQDIDNIRKSVSQSRKQAREDLGL